MSHAAAPQGRRQKEKLRLCCSTIEGWAIAYGIYLGQVAPRFPLDGARVQREQALARRELEHEGVEVAELVVVQELVHHQRPAHLQRRKRKRRRMAAATGNQDQQLSSNILEAGGA